MLKLRLDGIRSILCIGAHADDIEIGCGGTILKLLEEYADLHVHWIVLSSEGERQAEALRSADRFLESAAKKSIVTQNFPDAYFPYNGGEIKEFFNELGETIDPDLVLTHRLEDRHQDHRLVAELTWNTFRNHLIFEYEIPKYEGDLGTPNVYMPLSRSQCEQKIEMIIQSFSSQSAKNWFAPETFWAMLQLRGIEAGPHAGYAEGLYCRKLTA
ncbi:MAG: PIG-L family deacetylase [Woeseia sp.]|nr:PIG-L family deacetylase [Woeseia sp.]